MATTSLILTNSPQLVATTAAYITSDFNFMYSFGDDPTVWHTFEITKDSYIDYSGAFGDMYAKLSSNYDTSIIVITTA